MASLSKDVLALRDAVIGLRREIHAHPELAFQEQETSKRIAAFLEGSGLAVRTGVGGTGLIASTPKKGGRTVLLRVDIDGLPIQEQTGAPYASRIAGIMHACGHDGHSAIGAGTARVLAERALRGTARILFQPAEEGEGGAQAAVRDGAVEGVDVVLGIHLWNELPVGTLGVKAGPLMAAVERLRIVVRGKGGHGGMPQRTHDPLVAAAHVVTALQTVVSREISPLEPCVLTIGSFHSGDAFNVIPDEAVLVGTIRTYDPALRQSMAERVRRISSGVAEALGCTAEVELRHGNPAVLNDPRVAVIARRAAVRVVGEDKVVEPEPSMGGEDMSVYFDHAPGCFVFVGSSNRERGLAHPHHSPFFDFDEEALAIGCQFLVEAAQEALSAPELD